MPVDVCAAREAYSGWALVVVLADVSEADPDRIPAQARHRVIGGSADTAQP